MSKIIENGIIYPIVKANKNGVVKCPYCLKMHKHGKGNGHRIAHCEPAFKSKQNNGYYVVFE